MGVDDGRVDNGGAEDGGEKDGKAKEGRADDGIEAGDAEPHGGDDAGSGGRIGGFDPTALGQTAGVASVVIAFGGTLAATAISPTFSWTRNALSELGSTATAAGTELKVALFNGGLVLGALFGLVFAWYLATTSRAWPGRLAGVAFGLTTASMAGIGLFPVGTALHVPVAIAYFLSISVTLVVAAGAGVRGGRRQYARWSVVLGATNVGVWVGWLAVGGPAAVGLAVPEIASSAVFVAWVLLTVRAWPVG